MVELIMCVVQVNMNLIYRNGPYNINFGRLFITETRGFDYGFVVVIRKNRLSWRDKW